MKIEVYSPTIRRKEMDAVLTALVEDKIGPGEQSRILIQIAREKLNFDYCLALRSPALALSWALRSLGLEQGQAVVISSLSPAYYLYVLNDLKLIPVFADVNASNANLSRQTIEKAIQSMPDNSDVKAIILHHTLGFFPEIGSITELNIPIIEDCSQSYVINPGTISADNIPLLTIMGLEERDMLTAGGGALLYTSFRKDSPILRNIGYPQLNLPPEYGLPDMNAAMGIAQFRGINKNLERRREIAEVYKQAALRTRHKCFISEEYNNYAFPLILETGARELKTYAKRKNIIVENAFDNTLVGQGVVASEQCPESYSLFLRTVLFPLYPRLRKEEIDKIAKLIVSIP